MIYRIAADMVMLLHFGFIIFAVFGGLIVLWKRKAAWMHLPAVVWSSIVNLAGWICPLTPLENRLQGLAGRAGYESGFAEHYIMPLVYPGGMTRSWELAAGVSVLLWNGAVYAYLIFHRRSKP